MNPVRQQLIDAGLIKPNPNVLTDGPRSRLVTPFRNLAGHPVIKLDLLHLQLKIEEIE